MRKIKSFTLLLFVLGLVSAPAARANSSKAECSKIQQIGPQSLQGNEIEKALLSSIKQQHGLTVRVRKFRTIEKLDRWILAEVEFDLLEPGIFVLEKTKNGYRIAAIYGGVELDSPEDTIRLFFIKKLPRAPRALFYCYNPKGAPFQEGE